LRHEYLSTWWQTLGGGEWQHGDLHVAAGLDDGTWWALCPFYGTNLQGELRYAGQHETPITWMIIAC
jgi:hypothetical protein